MNVLLAFIYPSTGFTNFEVHRLPTFAQALSSDFETTFLPLDPYNKSIYDYTDHLYTKLINLSTTKSTNKFILFFASSSVILFDQFLLIRRLSDFGLEFNVVFSLGDEYCLSLDTITSTSISIII